MEKLNIIQPDQEYESFLISSTLNSNQLTIDFDKTINKLEIKGDYIVQFTQTTKMDDVFMLKTESSVIINQRGQKHFFL